MFKSETKWGLERFSRINQQKELIVLDWRHAYNKKDATTETWITYCTSTWHASNTRYINSTMFTVSKKECSPVSEMPSFSCKTVVVVVVIDLALRRIHISGTDIKCKTGDTGVFYTRVMFPRVCFILKRAGYFFFSFLLVYILLIPCWKFGQPYLGKATASARFLFFGA